MFVKYCRSNNMLVHKDGSVKKQVSMNRNASNQEIQLSSIISLLNFKTVALIVCALSC